MDSVSPASTVKPPKTKAYITPTSVRLETHLELDYWEVDPAWDGKIFHSAAQASRPARSGMIPLELKINSGRNICIRMVTVEGECFQLNV